MATQALQYNNIAVSKNEFLRYSVTVTVLQFLKSKTALMSLTRPSDILFLCSWPTLFFGVGIDYLSDVNLKDIVIQYNIDSHINNVDDVRKFFHYIVNERNVNFNPDDMFEDYMSADGTTAFTPEECEIYNRLVEESFDICKMKSLIYTK